MFSQSERTQYQAKIAADRLDEFCQYIEQHSTITHLQLSSEIGDTELIQLATPIGNLKNLKQLKLIGCFGNAGVQELVLALIKNDIQLTSLFLCGSFDDEVFELLTSYISKLSLTELSLSAQFEDNGVKRLTNSICHMTSITTLKLNGQFDDAGAIAIANLTHLPITTLNVGGIFENEGAIALSLFAASKPLQSLSIHGDYTDVGMVALTCALFQKAALVSTETNGNVCTIIKEFFEEKAPVFMENLCDKPLLSYLSFSGLFGEQGLNALSIVLMQQNLTNLTELELMCDITSLQSLIEILMYVPLKSFLITDTSNAPVLFANFDYFIRVLKKQNELVSLELRFNDLSFTQSQQIVDAVCNIQSVNFNQLTLDTIDKKIDAPKKIYLDFHGVKEFSVMERYRLRQVFANSFSGSKSAFPSLLQLCIFAVKKIVTQPDDIVALPVPDELKDRLFSSEILDTSKEPQATSTDLDSATEVAHITKRGR